METLPELDSRRASLYGDEVSRNVETLVWRVRSSPMPIFSDCLLFNNALRHACIRAIGANVPSQITGHDSSGQPLLGHKHGHFLALGSVESCMDNDSVKYFAAWFPEGIEIKTVAALAGIRKLYVQRKAVGTGEVSIVPDCMGEFRLLLPQLPGTAVRWRTITPFVPTRHIHKKENLRTFLKANVESELRDREHRVRVTDLSFSPAYSVSGLRSESGNHLFRSYHLSMALSGMVTGPLCLGRHSHFGYGLFEPAGALA